MFEIRRYTDNDSAVWNDFVRKSRQGTFLFDRNYMDYHRDRFEDHSLMVFRNGKLFALLPANKEDETLVSHAGLTYGGLLTDNHAAAGEICDVFTELITYLRENQFKKFIYKPVPWIYHHQPAEEDLYALFNVCNAHLYRRLLSATIDLRNPLPWQRLRKRCVRYAEDKGVRVERNDEAYPEFWKILSNHLAEKYQAKPVHTLQEIELLHNRFPDDIQLYTATYEGKIVGGLVFYITSNVFHAQYSSATHEGYEVHALDAIYGKVLSENTSGCHYFDFGTSNENGGHYLNRKLIFEKEGWGARGVCYDWYEVMID